MSRRRGLAIGGIVAAVALLALGFGLTRADFGTDTEADADTLSAQACDLSGSIQLTAPSTVPVNSSGQVSASAVAPQCAYPDGASATIVFGDTAQPGDGSIWIDPSADPSGTAYATLNGSQYAVGDTVQVSAVLVASQSGPNPPTDISQTQTVTIVAAQSSTPTVTVEVPSTTVYAGLPFALSGSAQNVNAAMYPNGINLQILLDGTVVGDTTLFGESSGSVNATVDGTTAGSHEVTVQLTTGTGAPAATASQPFTVSANPASTAKLAVTSDWGPGGENNQTIIGTATGVDPAQYTQGAVMTLAWASEGNIVDTLTISDPVASQQYEVSANEVADPQTNYQVTVTLTDPTGTTAPNTYIGYIYFVNGVATVKSQPQ